MQFDGNHEPPPVCFWDIPETIRIKESELQAEERRLANFVEFIGEGRGSKALAEAAGIELVHMFL